MEHAGASPGKEFLVSEVQQATGPGRVNLIGDHTDYNQGLALPMAIDLGVTVRFIPSSGDHMVVTSAAFGPSVELPVELSAEAGALAGIEPPWGRLIGAMIALARPGTGGTVQIDATLPIGSGLSSSAALSVALAEVFGVEGSAETIARLCQRAEHLSGVPVGAMDPLICAGARHGHALLIDFSTLATRQIPLPEEAEIVVVDSGQPRALRLSAYATRVAECQAAAAVIGTLGKADQADLAALSDPVLLRRARHVISECRRVRECVSAFTDGDLTAVGAMMTDSHRSLASDFAVSTPVLDTLVDPGLSISAPSPHRPGGWFPRMGPSLPAGRRTHDRTRPRRGGAGSNLESGQVSGDRPQDVRGLGR
jgi:galactokinase